MLAGPKRPGLQSLVSRTRPVSRRSRCFDGVHCPIFLDTSSGGCHDGNAYARRRPGGCCLRRFNRTRAGTGPRGSGTRASAGTSRASRPRTTGAVAAGPARLPRALGSAARRTINDMRCATGQLNRYHEPTARSAGTSSFWGIRLRTRGRRSASVRSSQARNTSAVASALRPHRRC
jgi:hypothetical protein